MERTVQIFKDFITQKIEKATLSIEETERQIEEVKSIKKAIENSKASNNTCNIASPSELMIKYSLEDIVREFNLFRSITNYSYSDIISFLEMKKALDLPENEEVVMMLDLGYGNQKEPLPNHHLKKELAETVKYL